MKTVRVRGRSPGKEAQDLPNLIEIQLKSFEWFKDEGMKDLFASFSPIEDFTGNLALTFHDYHLGEPKYSIVECRDRMVTFEAPLKVVVRLGNRNTGEVKESEVYLGELPLMTETGTFVINGVERAVVSQLARSPGVYFRDAIDFSGQILYSAQIIPSEGAWLDFDTDSSGVLHAKIGQAHKFPATTLLRGINKINLTEASKKIVCSTDGDLVHLLGTPEMVKAGSETLLGRRPWADVVDPVTGEVLVEAGAKIDRALATKIVDLKLKQLEVAVIHPIFDTTMEKDPCSTEEEALVDIYRRERPGDPVTPDIAQKRLLALFFDNRRYNVARVGRYKLNKKLNLKVDENIHMLTKEDIVAIFRYIEKLDRGDEDVMVDEIDHLMNKRVCAVGELLQNQFRLGFLRMERIAKERMTSLDPEQITPQAVISTKPISASIKSFFGSSQLSQFMEETNPLAELTHKRKLSVLGPGGLSRQSAKLEVRDVHYSHYGRICPIETPEGPNIGLIGSLATYARMNDYGFLETPYLKVNKGRVTNEVQYLTADEEDRYRIAPSTVPRDEKGHIEGDRISVRFRNSYPQVKPEEVDFVDLSPKQIFSAAACLIPFLENDDANRALMGSNMQRQAVPLLRAESPYVKTGVEGRVARDSGAVIVAKADGLVTKVQANLIEITRPTGETDSYPLLNFLRSNQATNVSHRPLARTNQFVRAGEVIADGPCTDHGELALGRNIMVAFMSWEGYNYEDAIVLSERMVREDIFSSIHIEKYEAEARDTKVGPEEITRDIPNVGEEALKDLDEDGIIRIGAEVRTEDILVGKVAPKGQEELTSEEKLVRAIFGEKAAEMRDTSVRVPHGEKGKVVSVRRFSRQRSKCSRCETEYYFGVQARNYCERCGGELQRQPGDELPPGVNQAVRVFVAERRKVMVGDKMAGRHGNKGVVAKILPAEDMPHLPDGTPVDLVLNPLGVPSRMNVGQVMETHLGWVAHHKQVAYENPVFQGATEGEILEYLGEVTDRTRAEVILHYGEDELQLGEGALVSADKAGELTSEMALEKLRAKLAECPEELLERAGTWLAIEPEEWLKLQSADRKAARVAEKIRERVDERIGFDEHTGKCRLKDGRTGQYFNQPIAIGYIYFMKLHHLVEDKLHARSTGPYSLVTQQPLGGKAQFGGQRFGEMEVWALEAYGAAHTLQEILTIKSDDVLGRVKTYESIVKGESIMEPGIPESFKILIKELQSLGLQLSVESKEAEPVSLEEPEDEPVMEREN
jgi:DNA-directed RNA polymerase subunit beta